MPELGSLIDVIWYSSFLIASRLIGEGVFFLEGFGYVATILVTLGTTSAILFTFLMEKIFIG